VQDALKALNTAGRWVDAVKIVRALSERQIFTACCNPFANFIIAEGLRLDKDSDFRAFTEQLALALLQFHNDAKPSYISAAEHQCGYRTMVALVNNATDRTPSVNRVISSLLTPRYKLGSEVTWELRKKHIIALCKHKFANYVMGKLIALCEEKCKAVLDNASLIIKALRCEASCAADIHASFVLENACVRCYYQQTLCPQFCPELLQQLTSLTANINISGYKVALKLIVLMDNHEDRCGFREDVLVVRCKSDQKNMVQQRETDSCKFRICTCTKQWNSLTFGHQLHNALHNLAKKQDGPHAKYVRRLLNDLKNHMPDNWLLNSGLYDLSTYAPCH
jgi:hypothetical protein